MRFTELSIAGVFCVDVEPHSDHRGQFARTFCVEEFAQRGLIATMCQSSISTNLKAGTLRGLHFRKEADGEAKLIRCTQGRAFDVAVDLRQDSRTYLKWVALEISASAHNAMYIPPGCAHGFISLSDNTELLYMMSTPFVAGVEEGVRWDDPAFGIVWPVKPTDLSARDRSFAPYKPIIFGR